MSATVTLTTDRLVLRGFRPADRPAFAAMNADPLVMRHFVQPLSRAESDAFLDRIADQWQAHGWGLWAVERRDTGALVGHTGLWPVRFAAAFTPRVEVGWRLAAEQWGQGYATEAGRAALAYAFGTLGWSEVVSFTAAENLRSQAVMDRLGMAREPVWDFDHPQVPVGHRLRRHLFWRASRGARAAT